MTLAEYLKDFLEENLVSQHPEHVIEAESHLALQ
jgi:hypothetical protein